jgi:hypothetical protein
MSVFWRERTLKSGSWAHGLSWLIAPKRLIKDWHPKIRPDTRLGGRYVQFEPVNWSGPFDFAGRPAVKAISHPSQQDEALVVGYLIERGYELSPSHPNASHDVMDPTWHWRGLERCLAEPILRQQFNDLINDFASPDRVVWIVTEGPDALSNEAIPYSGMSTLDRMKDALDAATSDQWVSVMCGVRFEREQCLRLSEGQILSEFSGVLIQAAKIGTFVESAIP